MRGDGAPDRRGGGGRGAVRPDRHRGAVAGALPAAGGGGLAPRRNSGALDEGSAASRRRRAQLSGAAALCRRAPLRFAFRGVSLARPDAGGRGTAHAGRLGAPAGGRRGDRRSGPLGNAAGWPARGTPPPLSGGGRRRRTRAVGAAHREHGEPARLRPAGDRPSGRAAGARHLGRVDRGARRFGRIHAARAGACDSAAGGIGADVANRSGGPGASAVGDWSAVDHAGVRA